MMKRPLVLLCAVLGSSCSVHSDVEPSSVASAVLDGAAIWAATCEGCHGIGVAGAPVAGKSSVWTHRIAKGRAVLYEHAIEGFYGPKGTMMPARGGNDSLSDAEVKAAVDYMISLVK